MAAIPGTAYAITADADAVQFWHPSEGRLLGRIDSPPGGVRAVCALPDGQHFATAGDDGAIRIWAIDWGIGDSQG
jgi:pre-rRNA-processing protein IPI3